MFELPEMAVLAGQINETLAGKEILRGSLGNSPHKFVWYNRSPVEFEKLTRGKKVGKAMSKGRWLFIPLIPGYVLVLGECGGKILYHQAGFAVPKKFHLFIAFTDGSALTATTQMWGAMELYESGRETEREIIKDMKVKPDEPEFTFEYFSRLIDSLEDREKRSAKGLLTQDQIIPGLGNAIAQDILFYAGLHPRHIVGKLNKVQRRKLYNAILKTVCEVTQMGGRYDETDLYGQPGKYIRLMDKNTLKHPCPQCSGKIEKIQYLGGACYFCPHCQQ
jgi:formamidopyrimidine-DNA glycosylase